MASTKEQPNMDSSGTVQTLVLTSSPSQQITLGSYPEGNGTLRTNPNTPISANHAGYIIPHLTEIPAELVDIIFEYLKGTPADALCLGLSSPSLYPFVQKLYKKSERDLYARSHCTKCAGRCKEPWENRFGHDSKPLYRQLKNWMGADLVFSGYFDCGKVFISRKKVAALYAEYNRWFRTRGGTGESMRLEFARIRDGYFDIDPVMLRTADIRGRIHWLNATDQDE